MAVGLDADADYLSRSGQLGGLGISSLTLCGWHYRNATVPADVGNGVICAVEANAGRFIALQFDNNFGSGLRTDPNLTIQDQVGQVDFGAPDQPPFDAWVFYILKSGIAGGTLTAEWSEFGSSTWHTQTKTTAVEGSVTPQSVFIGRQIAATAGASFGRYAYWHAVNSELSESAARTLKDANAPHNSPWAFWPLDDNTDTADDSGNARTLTFNGTITSETSPTLSGVEPERPSLPRVAWGSFPKKFMRRAG